MEGISYEVEDRFGKDRINDVSLVKMGDTAKKLKIWKGCSPLVAEAVCCLEAQWSRYSDRGGRYRLGRLIYDILEPGWKAYVRTIRVSSKEHCLCENFEVLRKPGKQGFRLLEEELKRLSSELVNLPNKAAPNLAITLPTLDTILEVIRACERKRPLRISLPAERRRKKRWFDRCQLCGSPTEVEAFIRMGKFGWSAAEKMKLSGKYCQSHRPKLRDGTWNPTYRRDIRKGVLLEKEMEAVRRNCDRSEPILPRDGADSYLQAITKRIGLRCLDDDGIASLARALVDCRIDAKRRKILALSSEGRSQSEIARLLSLDRQGVFKVIHSTKLKEFHSIVERLVEEAEKQEPKRNKQLDEILLSSRIRRMLSVADERSRRWEQFLGGQA